MTCENPGKVIIHYLLSLVFELPLSIVDLSQYWKEKDEEQDFVYSYYISISLKSKRLAKFIFSTFHTSIG